MPGGEAIGRPQWADGLWSAAPMSDCPVQCVSGQSRPERSRCHRRRPPADAISLGSAGEGPSRAAFRIRIPPGHSAGASPELSVDSTPKQRIAIEQSHCARFSEEPAVRCRSLSGRTVGQCSAALCLCACGRMAVCRACASVLSGQYTGCLVPLAVG